MHILIIGGTGFLGYHIVNRLLAADHQVTVLCRHQGKAETLFDERVNYHIGDLNYFHQLDFSQLFHQIDAVIMPRAPMNASLRRANPSHFFISTMSPLALICWKKHVNIRSVVVLS